jgi:hypothetical protein
MKVSFLCHDSRFFYDVSRCFFDAKLLDFDSLDLAELHYTPGSAKYITCRENSYSVEATEDGILFTFEGSREALQRLEPFPEMRWMKKEERFAIIEVNNHLYELELVSYETSTPPDWNLMWFDVVEPILQPDPDNPTEARVLRDGIEIKRVQYKRVYPQKPSLSYIEWRMLASAREAERA